MPIVPLALLLSFCLGRQDAILSWQGSIFRGGPSPGASYMNYFKKRIGLSNQSEQ